MKAAPKRLRMFATLLLAACSGGPQSAPPPGPEVAVDFGDGPATDFYQWVNAEWIAANPVPEEQSSWGVFHEVDRHNQEVLKAALEQAAAAADPASDTVADRLGVFWNSGMDAAALEAAGSNPLRGELARIAAVQDKRELPALFAHLLTLGVPIVFSVSADADLDDSSTNIAWMMQAGWGLPEKDYYLRTDDESEHLRIRYAMHIAKLMTLLGDEPSAAVAAADAIGGLERALAQHALGKLELRDPASYQEKRSFAELQELAPAFDWNAYFAALGVAPPAVVNTPGPQYLGNFDRLYSSRPLADWKALMRYHLARHAAPYLADEFARAEWEFYGKALHGAQAMKPRWKRVLAATEDAMGEGVGRLFVEQAFSPRAKEMADAMIDDLVAAFRASLQQLDWMGEETRAQAIAKLDAMGRKIGYPDTWEDYRGLHFAPGAYLHNAWAAKSFHVLEDLEQIGQPVDRAEWEMDPHAVNAYYNPLKNEIVFPAGILQPPFFSEEQSRAENYGAMGAVIGHEITHGFDDLGSQFDAQGNLVNWWTDADRAEFERRSQVLVAQYDACVAIGDLHVDGRLTLGENIADLGGVKMAYRALMATKPGPALDHGGMTAAQRFFWSWARAWRWNVRPERLKLLVQTDGHSPNPFRANLPLGNLQAYADAFGLDDSAPMMLPASERAAIW